MSGVVIEVFSSVPKPGVVNVSKSMKLFVTQLKATLYRT